MGPQPHGVSPILSPPKTSMADDIEMAIPTLRPPKSIGHQSTNACEPPGRLHYAPESSQTEIDHLQSSQTRDFPPPTKTKMAGDARLTVSTSQPPKPISNRSYDASESLQRSRNAPEQFDSKFGSLQTPKSHGRKYNQKS